MQARPIDLAQLQAEAPNTSSQLWNTVRQVLSVYPDQLHLILLELGEKSTINTGESH